MRRKVTRASDHMIGRARELRHDSTCPERLLWSRLKDGQCAGLKFRRQQAFEKYVVDYYCPSARLIIEIDGESHDGRVEGDRERQDFLEARGLRVIRFTNDEVLANIDEVLEVILRTCGKSEE